MPAHSLDRADQRVAVGAERERAVDELLDAGPPDGGEVGEAALQLRSDAVEVVRQQLEHEVPRRLVRRPRPVVLLVGAEQDALALLAGVDLARRSRSCAAARGRSRWLYAMTSGIGSVSR